MNSWSAACLGIVALVGAASAEEVTTLNRVRVDTFASRDGAVVCLTPGNHAKISAAFGVRLYDPDAAPDANALAEARSDDGDYLQPPVRIVVPRDAWDGQRARLQFGVCLDGLACLPSDVVIDLPATSSSVASETLCN